MNKTLTLIVAASVLMVAGLSVVYMAQDSLGGTDKDLDRMENSKVCQFQIEKAEKTGDWSNVDPECKEQQRSPAVKELGDSFEDELT